MHLNTSMTVEGVGKEIRSDFEFAMGGVYSFPFMDWWCSPKTVYFFSIFFSVDSIAGCKTW